MTSAEFTPSLSPSASASTLQSNLGRLASRRNLVRMWRCIAQALTWGFAVAVLLILAYRFYLVDGPVWVPAIPILLSLLIGWRIGVLSRGSTFEAALEADEKLDWKEQLSSALAFAQPGAVTRSRAPVKTPPASWKVLSTLRILLAPRVAMETSTQVAATTLVPSLVEEAAQRSQSLQPKQLYPVQFDRTHRVLSLVVLLFLVAAFMPNVPWLLADEERKHRNNIAQQGEGLVAIAKEVEKEKPKVADENAEAKRLAKRMDAVGRKMMRGRMGKKEALTSLGELKKDLEKASKNDGQNQNSGSDLQNMQAALEQLADQPMESEAGKHLQEAAKKGDAEQAAREMEKLADKMDKGEMSKEEKQKAANDLQKMAKSLKQQGGEQNQKMAEQLEQAAKALQQPQQQSKKGQQNQQQQGQQGKSEQGQNGGQTQQQQQGGNQGASSALRQMAKSMRQNGNSANSQQLQKMLNKIRQAERDTGMSGQGQAGMGRQGKMGMGNGNCPGGDCGQGVIPGKDLKANDPRGPVGGGPGLGPRNNAQGSKAGGGVSDIKSKRTGDKRRWEDVWSDRLPATRKKIDRVNGKYADDGEMEQLPTKTEAKGGPVKTPYYEVYESYKKDAEDAVEKESVPPAYKQPVKDYFESIKPN